METVNYELTQPDVFKGQRRFEIFKERYLRVQIVRGKRQREFALDTVILSPTIHRESRYSWRWLWSAVIAGLLSAGLFYLPATPSEMDTAITLPLALLSLVAAFGAFFLFFHTIERKRVFRTRYGNLPLIEILDQKKNPDFMRFVTELSSTIEIQLRLSRLSEQDLRAGELRSLRRLAQEGAIDETSYAKAKAKVLGQAVAKREGTQDSRLNSFRRPLAALRASRS